MKSVFAKACGCAPPRTFPDLVKNLKVPSAESYFWVSRFSVAFCASLDSRELFCAEFRTFQDESAVCSMYQDRLSDGKAQLPWQGVVSYPMLGVGLVSWRKFLVFTTLIRFFLIFCSCFVIFQYWHKACFTCQVCKMTLTMKNYKGYDKNPYCQAWVVICTSLENSHRVVSS